MSEATRPLIWLVGASSGIGAELAAQLLPEGYRLAISARRGEQLRALANALTEDADQVGVYPLDVTHAQAVASGVAKIEAEMGPISIAIINTGDYSPMPVKDFSIDLFRRLMEVNYMGVVHCLAALLPRFMSRRTGQILITASIAGYRGLPLAAPYSAGKAAVINMAEALQPELAEYNVQMRVINPGFVATDLTRKNSFRMPFLLTPEDAATRIVQGLKRSQFEIAFPRRFAWLMKLLSMLPYRLYFALVRRVTRT